MFKVNIVAAYHSHGIQLSERRHAFEKKYYKSSSFHSLDCTSQKIGCNGFEILQDAHSEGLTKDFM